MMCGRHSSIRNRLSPALAVVLATGGWWLMAGAGAMAAAPPAPASGSAAAGAGGRAVAICCAWGSKMAHGVLTYAVNSDDPGALSIIQSAVKAWDDALPDLTMTAVTKKPDITITYGPGSADGGESPGGTGARGLTTTYLNGRHLVVRVEIGIDGGPAPVSAGAIEEIAKHEIGHSLGLGHANWDGDLMSPLVNPTPAPIPPCDINGVIHANSWRMVDHGRRPKPATATSSAC
jgi:hypothetical protein